MTYTMGSLFDGSGGFPLAGTLCGIAYALEEVNDDWML